VVEGMKDWLRGDREGGGWRWLGERVEGGKKGRDGGKGRRGELRKGGKGGSERGY